MGLTYTIGFRAETSQLEAALARISSSVQEAFSSFKTGGTEGFSKELKNGVVAASQLQAILKQATTDKGLSFQAIDKGLKQAGTSAKEMYSALSKAGMDGAADTLVTSLAMADRNLVSISAKAKEFGRVMTQSFKFRVAQESFNFISSALQEGVQWATQLEAKLNSIQVVTGKTAAQMANLSISTQENAERLSTTAQKYADAQLIFYQQGLDDAEVQRRSDITIKAAAASGETIAQMSSELTAAWNTYGIAADQMERAASITARMGAESAVDFKYIAEAMQISASAASQMGLSYENLNAIIATTGETTMQSASVTGNAWKTILSRFQQLTTTGTDGEVTLGQVSSKLQALGIEIMDENGKLNTMDDILTNVIGNWKNWTKEQQLAIAEIVGGTRQYGQVLAAFNNSDRLVELMGIAQTEDGSTLQKQYETTLTTAKHAKEMMEETWQKVGGHLFDEKSMKTAYNLLTGIGNIVDGIVTGFGGMQGVISTICALLLNKMVPALKMAASTISSLWQNRNAKAQQNAFDRLWGFTGEQSTARQAAVQQQYDARAQKRQNQSVITRPFSRAYDYVVNPLPIRTTPGQSSGLTKYAEDQVKIGANKAAQNFLIQDKDTLVQLTKLKGQQYKQLSKEYDNRIKESAQNNKPTSQIIKSQDIEKTWAALVKDGKTIDTGALRQAAIQAEQDRLTKQFKQQRTSDLAAQYPGGATPQNMSNIRAQVNREARGMNFGTQAEKTIDQGLTRATENDTNLLNAQQQQGQIKNAKDLATAMQNINKLKHTGNLMDMETAAHLENQLSQQKEIVQEQELQTRNDEQRTKNLENQDNAASKLYEKMRKNQDYNAKALDADLASDEYRNISDEERSRLRDRQRQLGASRGTLQDITQESQQVQPAGQVKKDMEKAFTGAANLAGGVMMATTAITAFYSAIDAGEMSVSTFITSMAMMAMSLPQLISGFKELSTAMNLASPKSLVIVAAAITAIVAAFTLYQKHLENIYEANQSIADSANILKSSLESASSSIKENAESLKELKAAGEDTSEVMSQLSTSMADVTDSLAKAGMKDAANEMRQLGLEAKNTGDFTKYYAKMAEYQSQASKKAVQATKAANDAYLAANTTKGLKPETTPESGRKLDPKEFTDASEFRTYYDKQVAALTEAQNNLVEAQAAGDSRMETEYRNQTTKLKNWINDNKEAYDTLTQNAEAAAQSVQDVVATQISEKENQYDITSIAGNINNLADIDKQVKELGAQAGMTESEMSDLYYTLISGNENLAKSQALVNQRNKILYDSAALSTDENQQEIADFYNSLSDKDAEILLKIDTEFVDSAADLQNLIAGRKELEATLKLKITTEDDLNDVIGKANTLQTSLDDAVEEFNENGFLSADTAEGLIDAGYIDFLTTVGDKIMLTQGALDHYNQSLEDEKQAVIDLINMEDTWETQAVDAITAMTDAKSLLAETMAGDSGYEEYVGAINDAIDSVNNQDLDGYTAAVDKAIESLGNLATAQYEVFDQDMGTMDASGIEAYNKQLNDLGATLQGLSSLVNSQISNLNSLGAAVRNDTQNYSKYWKQLSSTVDQCKKMAKALGQIEDSTEDTTKKQKKATSQSKELSKSYQNQAKNLEITQNRMKKFDKFVETMTKNYETFAAVMDEDYNYLGGTEKELERFAGTYGDILSSVSQSWTAMTDTQKAEVKKSLEEIYNATSSSLDASIQDYKDYEAAIVAGTGDAFNSAVAAAQAAGENVATSMTGIVGATNGAMSALAAQAGAQISSIAQGIATMLNSIQGTISFSGSGEITFSPNGILTKLIDTLNLDIPTIGGSIKIGGVGEITVTPSINISSAGSYRNSATGEKIDSGTLRGMRNAYDRNGNKGQSFNDFASTYGQGYEYITDFDYGARQIASGLNGLGNLKLGDWNTGETTPGNTSPGTPSGGNGNGGGGNGGGGSGKAHEQGAPSTLHRYADIDQQLDRISTQLSKIAAVEEDIYGLQKIGIYEQKEAYQIYQMQLYNQKYKEAQQYLQEDKQWLMEKYNALGLEQMTDAAFDNEGFIKDIQYWKDLMDAQYNEKDASGMSEEEWSAYEEIYNAATDAFDTFADTIQTRQEAFLAGLELIHDYIETEIAKITVKVELKVSLSENEIKRYEALIERLGETGENAAKKIDLLWQEIGSYTRPIEAGMSTYEDLMNLYKKLNLEDATADDLFKTMFGEDIWAEAKKNGTMIAQVMEALRSQIDQLTEYRDLLIETIKETWEAVMEGFQYFLDEFDQFKERLSNNQSFYETYFQLLKATGRQYSGQSMADYEMSLTNMSPTSSYEEYKTNREKEETINQTSGTSYTAISRQSSYTLVSSDGKTYSAASEKALDFIENAANGSSMTGGDGSVWKKDSNGNVTVEQTISGVTTSYTGKASTYTVGSKTGRNFIENADNGSTMTGGDGSEWTKDENGNITINQNGVTYAIDSSSIQHYDPEKYKKKTTDYQVTGQDYTLVAPTTYVFQDASGKEYTANSTKAEDFIKNAANGTQMIGGDGTVWQKDSNGNVTISKRNADNQVITYSQVSSSENAYTVASDKGRNFIENAAIGETMTSADGAEWSKDSAGNVTITKNGKTYSIEAEGIYHLEVEDNAIDTITDAAEALTEASETATDAVSDNANMASKYAATFINIIDKSMQTATASMEVSQGKLRTAQMELELLQDAYDRAVERGDPDYVINSIKEQLQEAENNYNEAYDEYYSTAQEAISKIQEDWELAAEEVKRVWSEELGGVFADLTEQAQDMYESLYNIETFYLDDYDKNYNLTKLTKQIKAAMEDVTDPSRLKEYNALLDEINQKAADGVKISQTDVDILNAKFELQQKIDAYEEAKNAKNSMKLQRDASGNWSYNYSTENTEDIVALETEVMDAQQNIRQLQKDYADELAEQWLQTQIEITELIDEIDWARYESDEKYRASIDARKEQYYTLSEYYADKIAEMNYEMDRSFSDTALGIITNYDSIEEAEAAYHLAHEDYHQASMELADLALDKMDEIAANFNETCNSLITDAEDTSTNVNKSVDEMIAEMQAFEEGTGKNAKNIGDSLADIAYAAEYNSEKFCEEIAEMIAAIDELEKKLLELEADQTFGDNISLEIANMSEDYYDPYDEDVQEKYSERQDKLDYYGAEYANEHGWESNEEIDAKLREASNYSLAYQNRAKALAAAGYTKDQVLADSECNHIMDLRDEKTGKSDSDALKYDILKGIYGYAKGGYIEEPKTEVAHFSTGGFTGNAGTQGIDSIPAVLAPHEYVLNATDTNNIFAAVQLARDAVQLGLFTAINTLSNIANMNQAITPNTDTYQLEQQVKIEASFPAVTNHSEIEDAFNNLVNQAAQYIRR